MNLTIKQLEQLRDNVPLLGVGSYYKSDRKHQYCAVGWLAKETGKTAHCESGCCLNVVGSSVSLLVEEEYGLDEEGVDEIIQKNDSLQTPLGRKNHLKRVIQGWINRMQEL